MTGLFSRYCQSLSPALRRYYRASVWSCLCFLALAFLHEWSTRQAGLYVPLRVVLALAPVLAMTWMFSQYLRFLRDCDELERRIELGALAWAAGVVMLGAMAFLFLLDAGLLAWSSQEIAAALCVLPAGTYAVVRGWLHRRFA